MASDGDNNLLVVLVETSQLFWQSFTKGSSSLSNDIQNLGLKDLMQQLLVFISAFQLLHEANKLAVFGVSPNSSPLLYASPSLAESSSSESKPAQSSLTASTAILQNLQKTADASSAGSSSAVSQPAALSGALSRALCLVKKTAAAGGAESEARQGPRPRILCLHGSLDDSSRYIAVMNAIFAAQRHGVVIDACMVGGRDSAFLQQAAHITGGVYLKPDRPGALLEYLLSEFTADTATRSSLRVPRAVGVDLRAACFCHKRSIDLGFVCSVCLSVFCQQLEECSTCGTSFDSPASSKKKRKA